MDRKKCLLNESLFCRECGECTKCDLNPNKICDNCMKCLNKSDADYTTIEIDDIYESEDIPDEDI